MTTKTRVQAWSKVYSDRKRADEYAFLLRLAGGKWYLDMHAAAVHALSLLPTSPRSMLELGAGTGRLSSRLLHRFSKMRLHALDGSQAMLGKARQNLRGFEKRVEFVHSDFGRRHWSSGFPKFDAVISTAAIHHLTGAGKRRLFQEVFDHLNPGGMFIVGDPVWPSVSALKRRDDLMWATYIQGRYRQLKGEDKPVGEILDWINATRDAEGDQPSSLEEQLQWMRDAEFKHVDCHWKSYGFAVFGGTRP